MHGAECKAMDCSSCNILTPWSISLTAFLQLSQDWTRTLVAVQMTLGNQHLSAKGGKHFGSFTGKFEVDLWGKTDAYSS